MRLQYSHHSWHQPLSPLCLSYGSVTYEHAHDSLLRAYEYLTGQILRSSKVPPDQSKNAKVACHYPIWSWLGCCVAPPHLGSPLSTNNTATLRWPSYLARQIKRCTRKCVRGR